VNAQIALFESRQWRRPPRRPQPRRRWRSQQPGLFQLLPAPRRSPDHPHPPRRINLTASLYPFQREGLEFLLAHKGRALLADDMGLGKTVQALAFIAAADPANGGALPALIIAPGAVLPQWEAEIRRFIRLERDQPLRIHRIKGLSWRPLPAADFYLAHYDLVSPRYKANPDYIANIDYARVHNVPPRILANPGRAIDIARAAPRTVILDEVQALRHRDTERFRSLMRTFEMNPPKHIIGLSGTPLYNRGEEFWPIAHAIKPSLLGDFRKFAREWLYPLPHNRYILRRPREFGQLLARELMLRRTKEDVAADLPQKRRIHQITQINYEKYREALREIGETYYHRPIADSQRQGVRMGALSRERHEVGVLKVPAVSDWLSGILESGEQAVVFAHHHDVLDGYLKRLARFSPQSLTGTDSKDQRERAVAAFRSGESRVLLASLRVAGLGLNLQCAHTVVFAEFDWSPAVHLQAEDRCHRIGQSRDVTAYYAEAPGTLDDKILEVCDRKLNEINAVMGAAESVDAKDVLNEVADEFEKRLQAAGILG